MIGHRLPNVGTLLFSVCLLHGSALYGEQYFRENPLPNASCPEWYAVFMQHHPTLTAQQYYGRLHDGIDIGAETNDAVYSPNAIGTTAKVAFVGKFPSGKVLVASGNCFEPEAVMLGHRLLPPSRYHWEGHFFRDHSWSFPFRRGSPPKRGEIPGKGRARILSVE